MTTLSEEQLLELNRKGLIPGPGEAMEPFCRRAEYCLTLKQHLTEELKANIAGIENDDPAVLQEPCKYLEQTYDIAPTWIPVFFSNYRLPFWHGGCAWIFQVAEDSPTAALIQMRQKLRNGGSYLGMYSRDELLSHELTHVARMAYQEQKYEEVLAYRTSNSRFRRWFGPIIQSSGESVIFVLLLFVIIVFDVFLVAMQHEAAYRMALWLKLIPLAMIAFGLYRLRKTQRALDRCVERLGGNQRAWQIAFRLTDAEIQAFGTMSTEAIRQYASEAAKKELRWQVIELAYF